MADQPWWCGSVRRCSCSWWAAVPGLDRLTTRFARTSRTSRTRRRLVARAGSVRSLVRIRQVLTNIRAARIGPTVCDLYGPMPIENRSKTPTAMLGYLSRLCVEERTPECRPPEAVNRGRSALAFLPRRAVPSTLLLRRPAALLGPTRSAARWRSGSVPPSWPVAVRRAGRSRSRRPAGG